MYHHQFDYQRALDIYFDDGKFFLKLEGLDPVEVPEKFGVNLGDFLYEIIEDSTKKERNRIVNVCQDYIGEVGHSEENLEALNKLIEIMLEDD
jgi:hypothetical protein